jgi:hypothetical protein
MHARLSSQLRKPLQSLLLLPLRLLRRLVVRAAAGGARREAHLSGIHLGLLHMSQQTANVVNYIKQFISVNQ